MSQSEHFVQFCETDEFLVSSVGTFIGNGLKAGEACIVVATPSHRESLEEYLKEERQEIAAALTQGQYISLDAAATLSQFMINGEPSPEHFTEVIGSTIAGAANGRPRVCGSPKIATAASSKHPGMAYSSSILAPARLLMRIRP